MPVCRAKRSAADRILAPLIGPAIHQDQIRSLVLQQETTVIELCAKKRFLRPTSETPRLPTADCTQNDTMMTANLDERNLPTYLNQFGLSWILDTEPLRDQIAMLNEGDFAPWKGDAYAELCRFVVATRPRLRGREGSAMMEGACKILKAHLQNERLVLVGVAVWKTQCQEDKTFDGGLRPSVFIAMYAEWMNYGWKTNKAKHRESNAIGIIQKLVRPFLE
jgi:hypothetical protein